ncbi:hypothetical protein B0H15DRAFT_803902 [Mycena belliarum]|uniref:Uncharacterized protein n=1 Tax=Mycena belliarum TaxID=1033014 RepID=A0AAD6TVA7_9AGAR|nr:hypothetical protein B0H15DRAFT_803902 [Mycena belliae]
MQRVFGMRGVCGCNALPAFGLLWLTQTRQLCAGTNGTRASLLEDIIQSAERNTVTPQGAPRPPGPLGRPPLSAPSLKSPRCQYSSINAEQGARNGLARVTTFIVTTMLDLLTEVPLAVPLLCTPSYFPDPGHEDRLAHSRDPNGVFYGLIHGRIQGVVTSRHTLDAILDDDPTAAFIEATTWLRLLEQWNLECGGSAAGIALALAPALAPHFAYPLRHPVVVAARKAGGSILPLSPEEVEALWRGAVIVSPEAQAERNAAIVEARHAARIEELRLSARQSAESRCNVQGHKERHAVRPAPELEAEDEQPAGPEVRKSCSLCPPAERLQHSGRRPRTEMQPRRGGAQPQGKVRSRARVVPGFASGAVSPLLYDPATHPWGDLGRLSPVSISDDEEGSTGGPLPPVTILDDDEGPLSRG